MFTLAKLLKNRALWPAHEVVSGASGLNRSVSGAGRLEVPDFASDRHPRELLFTTGYFLSTDDADAQRKLIHRLCDDDIPGLVLKIHRYLPGFPQPMLDEADTRQFPLIEVGTQTNLNRLVQEVIRFVYQPRHQAPHWLSDLQHHIVAKGTFAGLVEFLEAASDVRMALIDPAGFAYPLDGKPIACQVFGEQWTIRTNPIHHPQWVRVSRSSYVGEGIAVGLNVGLEGAKESDRLVLYTQHRTIAQITDYLEFWLSILPFLRLLAKTAIDQFWSLRHTTSDAWVADGSADDTTLARLGMDSVAPKQWITLSSSLEVHEAWTAAELFRMRHRLTGVTIADATHVLMLWQLPTPAPDEMLSLCSSESRLVLSQVFYDLKASRRHYNMARAVSLSPPADGHQLVDYSSNLLFPLLDYIPLEVSRSFVQNILGPLTEGGAGRRDLLETLFTFFETNSLKDTATRLHVHYNTVVYRLDQLEKMLNRDFRNYDQRLELLLATFLWNKFRVTANSHP